MMRARHAGTSISNELVTVTSELKRAHPKYWTAVLFTAIVSGALIGTPLFGYLYGYTWLDWALFAGLYIVTGLGITVGYHRLIAHRSFHCPNWIKVGLVLAGGLALQNSALKWGADHLRHHSHCDQEADPYNAKRGFWFSHCGWLFINDVHADERYATRLRQDPTVMWQHQYYLEIVLGGLALTFLVGFLHGGWIGGIGCFLLAGVGRTFAVLNSTFCINSICHLWGSQAHAQTCSSRDSWWISLITFGEGYHNYHHTFQRDYRNGPRWYNFDPSKWVIYSLSKLGLASSLQRAHSHQSPSSVSSL